MVSGCKKTRGLFVIASKESCSRDDERAMSKVKRVDWEVALRPGIKLKPRLDEI